MVAEQALVLGGGGVAGIAWMTGLLAGLAEAGDDLTRGTGLVIGTSAGANVPGRPLPRPGERKAWPGCRPPGDAPPALGGSSAAMVGATAPCVVHWERGQTARPSDGSRRALPPR